MSQRADDLARRFEQVSEAFAAEMEGLSAAQWAAFAPEDQRPVAAMARHVGWSFGSEMADIVSIATGRAYAPMNDAGLAVVNAAPGEELAACDQVEAVAFLRSSAFAAAEVRTLTDEQLIRNPDEAFVLSWPVSCSALALTPALSRARERVC